jgi:hypothetical protein
MHRLAFLLTVIPARIGAVSIVVRNCEVVMLCEKHVHLRMHIVVQFNASRQRVTEPQLVMQLVS